jgi:hypothetical protein
MLPSCHRTWAGAPLRTGRAGPGRITLCGHVIGGDPRMTRTIGWLVAAAALGSSGCATWSTSSTRDQVMRAEVGGHRYTQPIDQVWPAVRQLLADKGLTLSGKDADLVGQDPGFLQRITTVARETESTPSGGLRLETDWTYGRVRFRAEAQPDAGGCRVILTRIFEHENEYGHDGRSMRDLDLELLLLQRIDPAAAARVDDLLEAGTAVARRPPPTASPPPPIPAPPAHGVRVE